MTVAHTPGGDARSRRALCVVADPVASYQESPRLWRSSNAAHHGRGQRCLRGEAEGGVRKWKKPRLPGTP